MKTTTRKMYCISRATAFISLLYLQFQRTYFKTQLVVGIGVIRPSPTIVKH
jgi:hypothetical protein